MNVSLTPELDAWVAERVKSGLYASASEVVRHALRLLREEEELKQVKLRELKALIQEGMDDIRAGRVHEDSDELWDGIMSEGLRRAAARRGDG